ncbi:MAG: NosD domain-containing protein [Promethearchaeota archaeon]
MKSEAKSKMTVLITLGILFAFSSLIITNHSLITGNSNISSDYSEDINLDKENLKVSKVSGKIHINGNSGWVNAETSGICTGNGTYSDPYVIEDLVIDAGGSRDCILIQNSDVYFRIENCTVFNSEIYPYRDDWDFFFAGIRLLTVKNSQLLDNNCSFNNNGIHVSGGFNNTITGNIAYNNNGSGIYVTGYNHTISGNTANNNDIFGIWLSGSFNNTVSGNIVSGRIYLYGSYYNNFSGNTANMVALAFSNYNNVSGNTANGIQLIDSDYNTVSGNDACWVEIGDNCDGNIFIDNEHCPPPNGDEIPFELIILISVISGGAVIGVATLLLIIRKRKRIQ